MTGWAPMLPCSSCDTQALSRHPRLPSASTSPPSLPRSISYCLSRASSRQLRYGRVFSQRQRDGSPHQHHPNHSYRHHIPTPPPPPQPPWSQPANPQLPPLLAPASSLPVGSSLRCVAGGAAGSHLCRPCHCSHCCRHHCGSHRRQRHSRHRPHGPHHRSNDHLSFCHRCFYHRHRRHRRCRRYVTASVVE